MTRHLMTTHEIDPRIGELMVDGKLQYYATTTDGRKLCQSPNRDDVVVAIKQHELQVLAGTNHG